MKSGLLLTTAVCLSGCCSTPDRSGIDFEFCAPLSGDTPTVQGPTFQAQCQDIVNNTRRVEILALSGGGSFGSWGAGVLRGWGENPSFPRPQAFDVVTGISTGALQGTFVFLGGENDYQKLSESYLSVDNDDIFEERSLLCALTSNSLRDQTPLLETLEAWIDDDTIDRVAGEAGVRRLYVGTVDLDCGQFTIWDMVEVARSGNYDGYRKILLAAASIPILAQPVELDGHLHVDAGVREQIFLKDILLPICEANLARRELEAAAGVPLDEQCLPPRLHLLVNGGFGVPAQIVNDKILDIAQRMFPLMLDQGMAGNLGEIADLVERFDLGVGVSWIPEELLPDISSDQFDPVAMEKMHRDGREWAGTTAGWETTAPRPVFIGPRVLAGS
jgi:hypothetical protein